MKRYEQIALMKKDIMHIQNKFDRYESFLGKEQRNLELLKKKCDLEIADHARYVNNLTETKAQVFDYLKILKQKLRTFDSKAKPTPKPVPKKNGNGKKHCDICGKDFASSGYPAHRKKCERIKALSEQLEKELNEGET